MWGWFIIQVQIRSSNRHVLYESDVILCVIISLSPSLSVIGQCQMQLWSELLSPHVIPLWLVSSISSHAPHTLFPLLLASPQSLYSSSITLSLILNLNTHSILRSYTLPYSDQGLCTEHTMIFPSCTHLKCLRALTNFSDLQLLSSWLRI